MAPDAVSFAGTERFEVLSRLGEGGMGVVYQAFDREQRTHVALKTMRTLSGDAVLRFKNEFRALQDLQHPNLINLGELISDGGTWFFTMELVDGVDFRVWVRGVEPEVEERSGSIDDTARFAEPLGGVVGPRAEPPSRAATGAEAITVGETVAAAFDEARLRRALAQLSDGLHALHEAGKIHRDIKPSNILVTRDGRVVLLDFGLAADVFGNGVNVSYPGLGDHHAVGTADYMAPEQAASKKVGPQADWYSVGVLLYEALTGRLPFSGAPLQVLIDKQRFEPVAPRKIVPAVPADLDALCVELLRFEPRARPSGREILRRLGVNEAASRTRGPGTSASGYSTFVGRSDELDQLHAAFAASRTGALSLIVDGESGVGKSALVQRFTRALAAELDDAVILAGRCHERESVPYKALDGVVDALSRVLMRASRSDVAELVPPHAALLAGVFPVLRRVEAISQAPLAPSDTVDPQELRTRLFSSLRELCVRLAQKRPLVVVIDDLQWADADSMALLGEMMRPPGAPSLLLVATRRTAESESDAPKKRSFSTVELPGDVRRLHLERLAPKEAREMVGLLLRRATVDPDVSAEAIAEEAGGHPLFIDELVRHVAGGHAPGPILLEEALWSRISRLDPPTRALLELVAVAGVPLSQAAAARAASDGADAGESFGEFARRVSLLRAANLVRTSGARGNDTVEPYHDRVREAVLWNLDTKRRFECHQRLAVALEASDQPDPEGLAVHWHGAGDDARATRYAAFAAAQAAEAFAFDRAARLYRMALEVRPTGGERRTLALTTRLGDVLASAGRGAEAAEAYLSVAPSAPIHEALELRRRAAEQLLRSGFVDDGLAAIRTVLSSVGMALPRTPRRALASLVMRRAQVRLRGYRFTEREPSQIAALALTRVDVCWSAAIGLALVDNVRGAYFQTRCLLFALAAGEPARIARALAMEAVYAAIPGLSGHRRSARLQKVAEDLARRIDDPHALGLSIGGGGISAYLAGNWRDGAEQCARAERIFRDRCTNVAWELYTVQLYGLLSTMMLGEVGEMVRRVPQRLREAGERGDLYSAIGLRTLANLAWLARDDLDGAEEAAAEAKRLSPKEGYYLPHHWNGVAGVTLALWTGDPRAAYELIEADRPALERSLFMRIQMIRIQQNGSRGRAALALAASLPQADAERRDLLRVVERDCRLLEREGPEFTHPLAALLRAGAAATVGESDRAIALLDRSIALFDQAEMKLHAQSARRHKGVLLGGDEGRALIAAADHWMKQEEIVDCEKMAALYAPGFIEAKAH